MKAVLSKYKSKDEGYPNVSLSTLQSKIEGLQNEITDVQNSIDKAQAETHQQKEGNVEELEKKLVEEQERVQSLIDKVTTSETLIRAETLPKDALDEAGRIKKKFDESLRRLA